MSETVSAQLDEKKCMTYGICVNILPDVFDVPKGALSAVLLTDQVAEDDLEDFEEAIRSCPAQAISRGHAPA